MAEVITNAQNIDLNPKAKVAMTSIDIKKSEVSVYSAPILASIASISIGNMSEKPFAIKMGVGAVIGIFLGQLADSSHRSILEGEAFRNKTIAKIKAPSQEIIFEKILRPEAI